MDSRHEIATSVFACICVVLTTGCISPQYAEVGKQGFVSCLLQEGNHDIYWRVNDSKSSDPPIAYMSNGMKGGKGYESGNYDILPNGNLVIELVSYHHERTYEAIVIGNTDTSRSYYIDLKVTVTPSEKLPTVENCFQNELCLVQNHVDVLQCVVGGAKPPAKLSWLLLTTGDNEIQLSTTNNILSEEGSITFRTISNVSLVPNAKNATNLSLYSCRASYAPYGTSYEKEVLLDWSPDETEYDSKSKYYYFEINSQAKLVCSNRDKGAAYLWKKQSKINFEAIAYRSPDHGNAINTDTYSVNELGDLIIHNVNTNTEGNYSCVSSSATNQHEIYQLIVVVTPSTSPAVSITECDASGGNTCSITSVESGELLCSVADIRPVVSLDWSTDVRSEELTILSGDLLVSERSYLYTITRTVRYKISHTAECKRTFSLICAASGPTVTFLDTKEARVTIVNGHMNCTNVYGDQPLGSSLWLIILPPTIIFFVILLTALFVFRRRGKRNQKLEAQDPEEMKPLQDRKIQESALKDKFLKYVKIAYETKIPDRDIHVMNKFSQLNPEKASSDDERYIELSSYLDLFTKKSLTRKQRLVLEGDAGCGKTSFAMCMAKEWLRGRNDSPMVEVNILIILSLIDFDEKTTIYDAIIEQLIPHDCQQQFSSADIETVLSNENDRVLIFLDGFDEFIERNAEENKHSYMYRLIYNKVLSSAFVVILTRSVSYLRVYGDSVLPIVKLHSFTNSEINRYIGKRFANDNEVEMLKKTVTENEHLKDICEIPFFLEMITRMIEETHEFEFPNSSSMTLFFQELINVKYSKIAKDERTNFIPSRELGEFAFYAIIKNKSAWRKEYIYKHFSEEELKTLLELRMMKEIQHSSFSTQPKDENVVVQFTHNIYKYYLAATFLSEMSRQDISQHLKDVDILTCQHLLIFSCGLSSLTFKSIFEHVVQLNDIFPYPLRDCFAMCLNEAEIEMDESVKALLKKQMAKAHALDVLNTDRKSLKKAKAHVLKLCEEYQIPVSMMRFENISLSIKDGIGICDKEAQLHYSFPPLEAVQIIDRYRKNANSSFVFSMLKNISTLREVGVFGTTGPSSLSENDIKILESKENLRLLLSWVNDFQNETGTSGMALWFPSLTFKRWMTYQEASVVKYMRTFKKSFRNMSEQRAVTIMAETGIPELFDQVGLGFIPRKGFSMQNEKFIQLLPVTVDILQKIDDAPREKDILFYSQRLAEYEKRLRPFLIIYKFIKPTQRPENTDRGSGGHHGNPSVSGQANLSNMPFIQSLKDVYFDVQV